MPVDRCIIRNTAHVSIRHFRVDTDLNMSGIQMLYKRYVFTRELLGLFQRHQSRLTKAA